MKKQKPSPTQACNLSIHCTQRVERLVQESPWQDPENSSPHNRTSPAARLQHKSTLWRTHCSSCVKPTHSFIRSINSLEPSERSPLLVALHELPDERVERNFLCSMGRGISSGLGFFYFRSAISLLAGLLFFNLCHSSVDVL